MEIEETGGEIVFYEFTITGDSDYDILEKEHEIISLNKIVWVKDNKAILWGDEIKIPFSARKEVSEFLKIKWIYKRK